MSVRVFLLAMVFVSLGAEYVSSAIEEDEVREGSGYRIPEGSSVQFLTLEQLVDPDLREIFNFRLTQMELIDHFRGKMREISSGCEIQGKFLSEVLFDFLTFRPFSRIRAFEVDEEGVSSRLSEIELIRRDRMDSEGPREDEGSDERISSYSEDESLSERLVHLIDGAVKASQTFHAPSLGLIESFLLQTSFPNKDRVLSHLHETRSKQLRLRALYDLQSNSLEKYLQLIEAMTSLPGFERFSFADTEEWKFRFLELAKLMKPLSHYVKNQPASLQSLVSHLSERMKTINLKTRDFFAKLIESGSADRPSADLCLKTVNRLENIFQVTSRYVLDGELNYKRKQLIRKHPSLF